MKPELGRGSQNEPLPVSNSPADFAKSGEKDAAAVILPSQPDYEVLSFIGRGAYGDVWLARNKEGCYWAVKVVYRISFDEDRPYEREYSGILKFEPISRLSDSQLQILHVGRRNEAGYFYYIMEAADDIASNRDIKPDTYLPHTLKSEFRKRGRIPAGESCQIALALTVALENLHQHGLVHRDIKPANIIFVNGRPKLADVGLVTNADKTMSCAGTEGYIPPEGPGSFRGDIYSLGKVLYEICTGCNRLDFPKLPENLEELPDHQTLLELNTIVSKACEANVRKRYQSARELRLDLERVARGKSVRRRVLPPVATVALVLVLLGGMRVLLFPRLNNRRSDQVSITTSAGSATLQAERQIDLTDYFNASLDNDWHNPDGGSNLTLRKLPTGLREFAGIQFDIRGIVQLSSLYFQKAIPRYPPTINGMKVNQKCRRLNFLHAAEWDVPDGTQVGAFVLSYADQQQHGLPIIYGEDVREWIVGSDPEKLLTRGVVAWTVRDGNYQFRLFKTTWENPMPDNEIATIDFVSKMTAAAPFLIAVTVE